MIVDLGCGGTKRGDVGIDVHVTPAVDYIVHLGIDPLLFPDNSVDRFVAYDFLEHLPVRSWVLTPEGLLTSVYSRIQLIREVYRCLKPGAPSLVELLGMRPNGHKIRPTKRPHGSQRPGTIIAVAMQVWGSNMGSPLRLSS